MNIPPPKIVCAALTAAIACASIGCANQPTFQNPTPATAGRFVHYGDPVTVTKKSGEEEKFTTWVITPTAIGSGRNTPIPYDDMREIRKERIDGGSTCGDLKAFGRDAGKKTLVVASDAAVVVLAAPFYIAGICLIGMAQGGGGFGRW